MNDTKIISGVIVIVMISLAIVVSMPAILSSNILKPAYAAKGQWEVVNGVAIAASGDNVYLTWPSNKTGNWEIMFRASNDSGNTFADKINLSNSSDSDSTINNGIAASGKNNVYVSWNDNKTGNVETYVRTSTDGGQTFGDIIKINGTGTGPQGFGPVETIVPPGEDILANPPEATRVAASGNNVYVLSWDNKTGNWEVFMAKSNNNGESFEDSINMSNSSETRSDDGHILAEGDNLYITWWETAKNGTRTPLFVASNDNGETFNPELKVAANGTIGESE